VHARFFPRIKNKKETYFSVSKLLLLSSIFLLSVISLPKVSYAQTLDCSQEAARNINCYPILWGSDFNPAPAEVKAGRKSGVIPLGPVTKEKGGFENDGTLKKISVVVTLDLDPEDLQYRPWNMVGSIIRSIGSENKKYLRLLDESFILRVYQKDASGDPINISYNKIPTQSFLGERNINNIFSGPRDFAASASNIIEELSSNKPLDFIAKYQSGAALFHRGGFLNSTDGYLEDGSGWGVNRVIGTAIGLVATRGVKGTIVGNLSGKMVNYVETSSPVFILTQTARMDIPINSKLEKGKEAYADLWYLGSDRITTKNAEGKTAFDPAGEATQTTPRITDPDGDGYGDTDNARIKYFDYQNGGEDFPYFQIGRTMPFDVPRDVSEATRLATAATTEASTIQGNYKNDEIAENSALPACSILNGKVDLYVTEVGTEGSFLGCVAQLVHFAIYVPIEWFASVMGNLFDFFLGYSLDDESYRADFIVSGWKMVRDLSNIFFIIILVWVGLAAALDIGSISMKKVVPALIINALIINFSLFATRVVIDVSNVFARIFYNAITVQYTDANGKTTIAPGVGGYKPLSEKIVSGFNPQRIFATKYASNASYNGSLRTNEFQRREGGKLGDDRNSPNYAAYYIMVSVLAALIVFSVAMMFWKTAFFFLGRVVGLYLVMMFSPFAFLTRGGNIPLVGNIQKIKWSDWVSELTKYALLAPIFMFFLYIVYLIVNSEFLKSAVDNSTNSFLGILLSTAIPMLIIYFIIAQGVQLAKTYAGFVGGMVQEWTNKAAGFAGGAAIGAGALVSARMVGGAAKALNESRFGSGLKDMALKKGLQGWVGRNLQARLNNTEKASFDIRQSQIGQGLFKQMGVQTNQKGLDLLAGSGFGLSEEQRKGGVNADIDRREEKQLKEAALLEERMTDEQRDAYNARKKKRYDKELQRIIDAEIDRQNPGSNVADLKKSIEELKKKTDAASKADYALKTKEYEDKKIAALKDADTQKKIAATKEPKQLKTTAEVTADRRKAFAENLKKGGRFTQTMEWLGSKGAGGQVFAGILGATVGTVAKALGEQVRTSGDRKAAKKIQEKSKIEKELGEIQNTLNKGFKDLIAAEMFQTSASFANINDPVLKERILKGEESMYDILSADEKAAVDARRKTLDKTQEKDYLDIVKAQMQTKFDMKEVDAKVKRAKDAWHGSGGNPTLFDAYIDSLREKSKAEELQTKHKNLNEYISKLRKELKPEEKKT